MKWFKKKKKVLTDTRPQNGTLMVYKSNNAYNGFIGIVYRDTEGYSLKGETAWLCNLK